VSVFWQPSLQSVHLESRPCSFWERFALCYSLLFTIGFDDLKFSLVQKLLCLLIQFIVSEN
jgi:hypothetical protein